MFLSTQTKQILVLGGSSFIGNAFIRKYASKYRIRFTYYNHPVQIPRSWGCRLNIQSEVRICELFSEIRPDLVIHCAGMTSTAKCEENWDRTYAINVKATHDLHTICQETNTRMIYLSTDFVFDGQRGGYEEVDDTFPSTRYGKSKRLAEDVIYHGPNSPNTILRLSLVYGFGKGPSRGFIGWLTDSLAANRPVTLFTDEYRTPVYIEDVVDILDEVVEHEIQGLYHIGGREKISRYEFGKKFAETLGYNTSCILPASIKDFQGHPPRPPDLSLNTASARKRFKTVLSGVEDGLRRMRNIQTESDRAEEEREKMEEAIRRQTIAFSKGEAGKADSPDFEQRHEEKRTSPSDPRDYLPPIES